MADQPGSQRVTLRSFPVRAPRSTLLVLLLVTIVLSVFARSVRVESSVENLLPADDPDRLYYQDVRQVFGSEEATLIAVFAPDAFAPETLAKIDRLSSRLAGIDGVREVISLTTVKGVEVGDLGLRIGRLMAELPQTAEEAAAFKERVLAEPLYVGHLVSRDGTASGILVLFDVMTEEEFVQRGIEAQIDAAVADVRGPEEFALTGLQTVKLMGAHVMQRDLLRYVPLAGLLVTCVLAWAFASIRGVVLPLGTVLVGMVWTLGFMGWSGRSFNPGTLVLPPLLLAIGIAYVIPLLSRYEQEFQRRRQRTQSVAAAVDSLRLPLSIAVLATVLGFAALAWSSIRAIQDFGILAVFGVSAIFTITLTLVPAVLVLLPDPAGVPPQHAFVTRCIEALSGFAARHRRAVLAVVAALCAVGVSGAARMRVTTDYLSFFHPRSSVRQDNERIAAYLGGTQPIYVTIDGEAPRAVARLEVLAAIRDLQVHIDQQPGVDSSLSLVDYIAVAQKALIPDATSRLPLTQGDLNQLLLFVTPADVQPVASADFSRANIIVRTQLSDSTQVSKLVRQIEDYGRTRFPPGISVRATGVIVLLNQTADALAHGHLIGLGHMLVVLFVLMSLMFLSVRAGIVSLLPIVMPIVLLFGVMGWLGVPLNISTCMIAVIAIAVTVPDTIHFLNVLNGEIHRTANEAAALRCVMRTVGPPIVFASLALAAAFAVFCLSSFQPNRQFGLLAGGTVLAALLANLLVTPALVTTTRLITLWDVLSLKLGPQPQREIPLFEGLRPFQARMVVLMARLASAEPGTLITRRGELKPELYVLLSGRVDVRRREGERVIRRLGRGDVIGEMGLVRQLPRSADVTVSQHVEYLVLDAEAIERIRRRYPRIAAVVLLNVTRILSDRLENTTDQLAGLSSEPEERPVLSSA